jgi:Cu+-exporting ATPase
VINRIKLNLFFSLFYNCIGIPLAAGLLVPMHITLPAEFAGAF